MTNLQRMKELFKQDIDRMTMEQFHNFYCLFDEYQLTRERYGIDAEDEVFYSCDKCRREHGKCISDDNDGADNVCFKLFSQYAEAEL